MKLRELFGGAESSNFRQKDFSLNNSAGNKGFPRVFSVIGRPLAHLMYCQFSNKLNLGEVRHSHTPHNYSSSQWLSQGRIFQDGRKGRGRGRGKCGVSPGG